jgi:hypothetical protein
MVALGFSLMIHFHLSYSESKSESGSNSFSLILDNNEFFERYSSMLCQSILCNSHQFLVFFFEFSLPFFYNLK